MTEEQIVQKVSELMDVKYSHYDNHKMRLDYFHHQDLKSIPKIVSYGGRYGPWEFAILEDMTIITSMSPFNKMFLELSDFVESKGIDTKKYIDTARNEIKNIEIAENFLKENNCSIVINNSKKKINWV